MSRCGCSTTCSCLIVAGDGTTVTGNGSLGNPYTITADAPPDMGVGFRPGAGTRSAIGGDLDPAHPATAAGARSIAIGETTSAGGFGSVAIGEVASADGDDATAVGENSDASGAESTAVGYSAWADGDQNVAIGSGALASSSGGLDNSTAVGASSTADKGGTAEGSGSQALGLETVAIGKDAKAYNDRDTVVGALAKARIGGGSGNDNTLIGHDAQSGVAGVGGQRSRTVAIGSGARVTEDDNGVIKVDVFEVVPSSGGLESAFILADSTGARWKITVDTTGHLTTDPA